MGLDTVELVMEIEEAFDITISDSDATAVRTVGDLHQLVLSMIEEKPSTRCISAMAFYRLRRAAIATLGIDRDRFRRESRLDDILGEKHRSKRWQDLSRESGLILPSLRWPKWKKLGAISVFLVMIVFGLIYDASPMGWGLLLLPWVVLFSTLLTHWATFLPRSCESVENLTQMTAGLNYAALTETEGRGTSEEIWQTIKTIVCVQLDVEPSRVTPEANILDLEP